MSAYLRSWLGYPSPQSFTQNTGQRLDEEEEPEVSLQISAPDEQDDSNSDSDRTETDAPPAFPALNSAQRLGAPSSSTHSPALASKSKPYTNGNASAFPKILTDKELMPPPPSPNVLRVPGVPNSTRSSLSVPSASSTATSSSLGSMPPPSNGGSTLGVPPSTNKTPSKKFREKVALAPGFGPLDWAALKSSGTDLRGVDTLLRVTPSMLKQHNKKDDAWSVFYGKVYNVTPYLPYHPGGEKELMRVAGRDGTKLFASTHAWVNVEFMLDACLVGFLVSESYGS